MFSNSISSGDMMFRLVRNFTGSGVTLYIAFPSVSTEINWSKLLCEHGIFFAMDRLVLLIGVRILLCFCMKLVFYRNIQLLLIHTMVMTFFADSYLFIAFVPSCLTKIDRSLVKKYPSSGVIFCTCVIVNSLMFLVCSGIFE